MNNKRRNEAFSHLQRYSKIVTNVKNVILPHWMTTRHEYSFNLYLYYKHCSSALLNVLLP